MAKQKRIGFQHYRSVSELNRMLGIRAEALQILEAKYGELEESSLVLLYYEMAGWIYDNFGSPECTPDEAVKWVVQEYSIK